MSTHELTDFSQLNSTNYKKVNAHEFPSPRSLSLQNCPWEKGNILSTQMYLLRNFSVKIVHVFVHF